MPVVCVEAAEYTQLVGNAEYAVGLLAQSAAPPPLFVAVGIEIANPSLRHIAAAVCNPFIVLCAAATLPFTRALLSEAKTTDDKMPIIAMTTKSSMRVKPRL